jgi:hypothetical protein
MTLSVWLAEGECFMECMVMELVYHIGWRCLAWDIVFSCWRRGIEGGNICISLSACQVIVNCKVDEGIGSCGVIRGL